MSEPGTFPEGFSVDAVDWLPSGARSGLIRVRGHRPPAVAGPLPELILEAGGETKRFVSLPDPRADRDPSAWRGAYVLDAKPAAEADEMWLEWPGQRRIPLPPLNVPIHQVQVADEPSELDEAGDEVVVDRAVLAERRARRAEAAEQAQARIAREALRAVEVLELRTAELEQQLTAADAERDALREQAALAGEAPDVRIEVLQSEIRELRAALAEREEAPAAVPADEPRPIAAGEAERRAERLRAALTATVATVAELRLRLHETEVARRTRDVARAADAVRLAVLDGERAAMTAELEQARKGLEEARRARDEAAAELQGVRAAYEDVQAQHRDLTAELGAARERMAELEAEVAAVGAEAERAARNATEAARAADTLADMQTRLAHAESALAEAETARELAEASALAADAQRQAASVASAAARSAPARAADEGLAGRHRGGRDRPDSSPLAKSHPIGGEIRQTPSEPPPSMPSVSELRAAADEQTARAEAERAPDDALAERLEAAQVRIRTEAGHPPADVARGRGGRAYPPLRGALVKLAHDDPVAAGRLLAGLLNGQHAVVQEPLDYDITIAEVGTFAVSPAGLTTLVSPIDKPRGRSQARFHIEGDALTLAETLSGVETKPRRRRGPLRAHGKVREARRMTEELREVSLGDVVHAGAELDPELVLRALAYAIRPAWTQGQVWVVELVVEDATLSVAARHSGGLTVTSGSGDAEPDARVALTAEAFRDLTAGDDPALKVEGDEAVFRRLLSLAERARSGTP